MGMSGRWLTVPAVSRISSIHCWPSTSTCCKRKRNDKTKQRVTDSDDARLFFFRSASTSVRKDAWVHVNRKQGRDKDGQIDQRAETKTKPSKGRTRRMDERRVNLQGSSWPAAPPTLIRLPAGTLTFLYESSIVGSYFSTKIPWTNWTVCEKKTETTSRLTSDRISRGRTKYLEKKTRHSPWCSNGLFK